ncbi:MAG: XamI family restriction endonuclease [Candidatus Kerfeldbacteria bacterium]|nr:XamI family restriction endonuclease [Candidatus Kerfeldbacteria bacterium]
MPINSDKPHLWKADIAASVDQFNAWFMRAAPKAYRDTRVTTTQAVLDALQLTKGHRAITADVLKAHPGVLPTLRMSTCPPIAVDRLVGLSGCNKTVVMSMEKYQRVPPRMAAPTLDQELGRISRIFSQLLDPDLFPWIPAGRAPGKAELERAATVVADRLCGALANPIVRNAQEQRQLALLGDYLDKRGYKRKPHPGGKPLTDMAAGTYAFRLPVTVGAERKVTVPIDVAIQPKRPRPGKLPVLIEAKSAGDYTNTNKRRKEEATKIRQLQATYGEKIGLLLFLCGYFDSGYLGYEAAEGIDWVWEHRLSDLDQLGL